MIKCSNRMKNGTKIHSNSQSLVFYYLQRERERTQFMILSLRWSKVNCVLDFLSFTNHCIQFYLCSFPLQYVTLEWMEQINRVNIAIFPCRRKSNSHWTSLPFRWMGNSDIELSYLLFTLSVQRHEQNICFFPFNRNKCVVIYLQINCNGKKIHSFSE